MRTEWCRDVQGRSCIAEELPGVGNMSSHSAAGFPAPAMPGVLLALLLC